MSRKSLFPFFKLCSSHSDCGGDRFGPDCYLACRCSHGARCDAVTGRCLCPFSWLGPTCSDGKLKLLLTHAQDETDTRAHTQGRGLESSTSFSEILCHEVWAAEPHHSASHPVFLDRFSSLLTVILICTQHGAGLEAVFVLPPQSQARGRRRTGYFSSKNPRTFAFDFQIVLMFSCFFPLFSTATSNPGTAEPLYAPENEKSRQQNHITQAEVQTCLNTLGLAKALLRSSW